MIKQHLIESIYPVNTGGSLKPASSEAIIMAKDGVGVTVMQFPESDSLNQRDRLLFEEDGNTWASNNNSFISFDQSDSKINNITKKDSYSEQHPHTFLEHHSKKMVHHNHDHKHIRSPMDLPPFNPTIQEEYKKREVKETKDAKSMRSRAESTKGSRRSRHSSASWLFSKIRRNRKKKQPETDHSSLDTTDFHLEEKKPSSSKSRFFFASRLPIPRFSRRKMRNAVPSRHQPSTYQTVGLMEDNSINHYSIQTYTEEDLFQAQQKRLSSQQVMQMYQDPNGIGRNDARLSSDNNNPTSFFQQQELDLQPVREFESTNTWNNDVHTNKNYPNHHLQPQRKNNDTTNHQHNTKETTTSKNRGETKAMMDPGIARREALMRKLNSNTDNGPSNNDKYKDLAHQGGVRQSSAITHNSVMTGGEESVAMSFLEADQSCVSSMTGTVEKISRQLQRRHENQLQARLGNISEDQLGNDRFLGKTIRIRHEGKDNEEEGGSGSENEFVDHTDHDDVTYDGTLDTYDTMLKPVDPHELYIRNMQQRKYGKKKVSWRDAASSSSSSSSSSIKSSERRQNRNSIQAILKGRSSPRRGKKKVELRDFRNK